MTIESGITSVLSVAYTGELLKLRKVFESFGKNVGLSSIVFELSELSEGFGKFLNLEPVQIFQSLTESFSRLTNSIVVFLSRVVTVIHLFSSLMVLNSVVAIKVEYQTVDNVIYLKKPVITPIATLAG